MVENKQVVPYIVDILLMVEPLNIRHSIVDMSIVEPINKIHDTVLATMLLFVDIPLATMEDTIMLLPVMVENNVLFVFSDNALMVQPYNVLPVSVEYRPLLILISE